MGTLTSYVGAIFVGRPLTKGSTGEPLRAKMGLSVSLFATLTVARERRRFSGIGRIALGVVAWDAPAVGASSPEVPRAIRAIPENRAAFRATVNVTQ